MALDPLLSPKPKRVIASDPAAVRVKATGRGIYGGIMREAGDVFYIDGAKYPKVGSSSWLIVLPDETGDNEPIVIEDDAPVAKKSKILKP